VTSFVLRRALWFAATLFVVVTTSFVLMRAVRGGPFDGERALSPAIEANLRARYHLDWPLWKQYAAYVGPFELGESGPRAFGGDGTRTFGGVLSGDFGPSFRYRDATVNDILAQSLPISLALGSFALAFALVFGVTAGVASARFWGSTLDVGMRTVATIGIGLPFAAYIARLTRAGMLDALSNEWIRTAHAKGLAPGTILYRHAFQAGITPVVSYLGPATAGILTGSLVIEKIFAIPGLGSHFVNSALNRDYTLAMGVTILYTALVCGLNALVDVAYTRLDPRVALEDA
jgi:oligopeptide transport system permease protein